MTLIDTSVWIEALRPRGNARARTEVDRHLASRSVVTCPVVECEILKGAKSEPEYQLLKSHFSALPSLPILPSHWERAARLGFELARKGWNVPVTDLLIGVVAMENQCTVLHCDRDFDILSRNSALRVRAL